MKKHLKQYGKIYQIIFIIGCFILSGILIYFGFNQKKKHDYTKEEVIGIMKLKADQFTRMMEISSDENSCKTNTSITLSDTEMTSLGFDKNFYDKISYTMKCEDEKQIILITIIGKGAFKGYQLENYISNNNKIKEN